MNIQDLGSIGELIAALATLLTLGYLAIQLKQNTSALKSQTFQQSSMDMSLTANSVSSDGELAKIIIKAENGMGSLSSDEKLRFHFWMLVAVRRFEAIYIQALYGSIEKDRIVGFETSILSLLSNVGNEWWNLTKSAFSNDFIGYADRKINSGKYKISVHPGSGVE
tara:strand:- start:185 stop:682 length:498 start_codon:yes stop_codon:yes gene_type:complete